MKSPNKVFYEERDATSTILIYAPHTYGTWMARLDGTLKNDGAHHIVYAQDQQRAMILENLKNIAKKYSVTLERIVPMAGPSSG